MKVMVSTAIQTVATLKKPPRKKTTESTEFFSQYAFGSFNTLCCYMRTCLDRLKALQLRSIGILAPDTWNLLTNYYLIFQ
jgi:hypothetical protein